MPKKHSTKLNFKHSSNSNACNESSVSYGITPYFMLFDQLFFKTKIHMNDWCAADRHLDKNRPWSVLFLHHIALVIIQNKTL